MAAEQYCLKNESQPLWIDLYNPDDNELELYSGRYNFDLTQARDMLQPEELPNFETLGDKHFILLRLYSSSPSSHYHTLQEITNKLLIIFNEDLVITIHIVPVDIVHIVKDKYFTAEKCGSAYAIVEALLKESFKSFEHGGLKLGNQIDFYESTIFLKSIKPSMLQGLYFLKRKAGICRKMLILTGEMLLAIKSSTARLTNFKDIRDLHVEVQTLFDQINDDVNNLLNTYLSLAAQKTNDVMKVLTIFSVFFMPLTFIVGVYGMNFKFMPELDQRWGYPAVIGFMVMLTIGLFFWMKSRRWL